MKTKCPEALSARRARSGFADGGGSRKTNIAPRFKGRRRPRRHAKPCCKKCKGECGAQPCCKPADQQCPKCKEAAAK